MMIALFLINAVLIIVSAGAGYLLGYMQGRSIGRDTKNVGLDWGDNQYTYTQIHNDEDLKINQAEEDILTPISTIKAPTADDVERKNRPKKVIDGEKAMEDTLDDLFSQDKGQDWEEGNG